jgi:hypothetical protein
MSKFSLDVLDKRVFPFVGTKDPDVMLGAAFGEDVALTRVGGDVLVSHVDPIVGAISNIGWLAVHVACNDIATSGAPPRWILLLVLVPTLKDEDLLEQIMRDAERAAGQTGKLKLNFQDASLDKELLELSEAYQSRAMQSGIKLELRNKKSLPFIKVDPHRMGRVFTNLLDNALKFSTKGGTITIITEETPQEVMISVRDEGQGIDLIAFESFFERGRENHSRHRLHLQTAERG